MKIPFDIKIRPQIESGEYKVETRDGKTVVGLKRQILHGTPLLYGIIEELECCEMWKEDGTANPKMEKDNHDLFIITPEPELSEFEQEVRVCVTKNLTTHIKDGNGMEMSSTVSIDDETAKKMTAELLELAKKELCGGCSKCLDEYWRGRKEAISLSMSKYIDAECLRAMIEKRINNIESCHFIEADFGVGKKREGKIQAYDDILTLITSLQQEQPEVDLKNKNKMNTIDKIRAEVERRRSEYEDRLRFSDWYGGTEDRIKMGECKQILSFIDSLQELEKGLDVTEFCRPVDPNVAKAVADHKDMCLTLNNHYGEFEAFLYSPQGNFIGIIRNEIMLLGFLCEIKKNKMKGYYLIHDNVKYDINENGKMGTNPVFPFHFIDDCLSFIVGF